MLNVGDKVTVTLKGEEAYLTIGDALKISPGVSLEMAGKIVEDLNNAWLVEVGIVIKGEKHRIVVPKSAQRVKQQ